MSDKNLSAQIARAVTVYKGKPTRKMMAQTGVDIEVLEQVYGLWEQCKETVNYAHLGKYLQQVLFTGYRQAFRESGLDGGQESLLVLDGRVLQRREVGNHSRYSSLLDVPEEYRASPNEQRRSGQFAIFLTRDLKWIIFTNFPTSKFQVAHDPKGAVELALSMLPPETYFGGTDDLAFDSLACELADKLVRSLRDSINARKKINDFVEPIYAQAKEHMNVVDKK